MSERLEIRLFGGLLIRRNGELITDLVSRKVAALVAYLARHQHPLSRDLLANLFWDDRGQEQASGNLRVALTSARKTLGDSILSNRQVVEINPATNVWVDANQLEENLLAFSKQTQAQKQLPPDVVAALEQGITLYQGEFLAGFSLREAELFETWVRQERGRFQLLVQKGFDALVAHYLAVGQYAAGIELAQRWLQLDPLNENALRQLLRLLGGTGQRNLAIQHFSEFRRQLIEDLGVEPAPETVGLYERLLETEIELRPAPVSAPAPVPTAGAPLVLPSRDLRSPLPHNLPSPLMPIIGREEELEQIQERLLSDACRLLTLTGMGGIGKTRLALEAANRLVTVPAARARFADGIYCVRLERIEEGELLPSIIAEALNFQFQGKSDPPVQLLAYLRSKQILLLLDNFEHLVDQSDLVLEILQQAPQVKIFATSRERLNFAGEWLIEVHGLPYLPPATAASDLLEPASQFFVRYATTVQPNFTYTHQRPAIAELCQLLDGSPLGLLLAASAVRTHNCQQIVDEIKHNLDFLAVQMRNVPERHRTLRAVFEHSWALLAPSEQEALPKLAIFVESFTHSAASQIAGVSPELLQSLADKSLIQRGDLPMASTPLAYKFHRTLFPFVAEKLAANRALVATLQQAYCAYFAQFIAEHTAALKGGEAVQAVAVLSTELENIQASWQQAAQQGLLTYFATCIEGFSQFYLLRGPLSEAQSALQAAIDQLRSHYADELATASPARRVVARLTIELARFYNERGHFDQALTAAQEALALATQDDHENLALAYQQWGAALHLQAHYAAAQERLEQSLQIAVAAENLALQAAAHFLQGRTCMYQGHYPRGQYHAEQAVVIYRQLGERYHELNADNSLALIYFFSGDYSTAQRIYERCLVGYRASKDERSIGRALNNLGAVAAQLGQYPAAQEYYQAALASKRAIGDRPIAGLILANLSLLSLRLGDYPAALEHSREALLLSQELGERDTQAYARFCMGYTLAGLGQLEEAAHAYRQALDLRRELGQQNQALEPLAGLARLHLVVGDLAEAQKLVEIILPHLQTDTLAGIVDLFRLYLTSFQVLQACQDERARDVLATGIKILQARAAKISDAAARHSYLQNILVHRELLAEAERFGN